MSLPAETVLACMGSGNLELAFQKLATFIVFLVGFIFFVPPYVMRRIRELQSGGESARKTSQGIGMTLIVTALLFQSGILGAGGARCTFQDRTWLMLLTHLIAPSVAAIFVLSLHPAVRRDPQLGMTRALGWIAWGMWSSILGMFLVRSAGYDTLNLPETEAQRAWHHAFTIYFPVSTLLVPFLALTSTAALIRGIALVGPLLAAIPILRLLVKLERFW